MDFQLSIKQIFDMTRISFLSCLLSIASAALAQGSYGNSSSSWPLPPPTFGVDGGALWGAGAWPPSNLGVPLVPQAADDELTSMLAQIDPERIKNIVTTLTNFGTRHTLSTQTDPVRGIGAARDWIAKEMRALAAPSNGSMVVTTPSYIQPVAERISFPVNITDIVATVQGYGDSNRAYVVTGHYDSRRLDIMNYTADAPGSDDNASGVAIAMEMARICANMKPYATMIFAAVAGEEQDLYGSNFLVSFELTQRGKCTH